MGPQSTISLATAPSQDSCREIKENRQQMLLLCIIISTPVMLFNHKESYHQYMKHMGKQLNLLRTFHAETSFRFNTESFALGELSQPHYRSNNHASSRQGMTSLTYDTT